MKKYRITSRITLIPNMNFDKTEIMNYKIDVEGFTKVTIIWSKGYAEKNAGSYTPLDKADPNSPGIDGYVTQKIFDVIKAIELLHGCKAE